MSLFGTLSRRFGLLYGLVIATIGLVCLVAFVQLEHIRTDSWRLMEETREQSLCSRITTQVDSLRAFLVSIQVGPEAVEQARGMLAVALADVHELDPGVGDPSREEHQATEERLTERLDHVLIEVEALIEQGQRASIVAALERLGGAKHYAEVLLSEAHVEARKANGDLQRRARATRVGMVATILIATLLLCVAWFFVSRWVVGPLGELARGAERIGHGDLAHRIQVSSEDEIGDLARTFNAMAGRLAESQAHLEQRVEARTREFLRAARLADLGLLASGIAHEINTPLASISSCAEGLQRRVERNQVTPELLAEYAATIRAETMRASGITSRMLALVREEPSELGPVSLQLLVEQVRSAIQHRLEKRNVRLVCEVPGTDGQLHVNGGELVQILVNLVANAIDASPTGGRVELRARVQDGSLGLEVEDEGSGIPPEDQERVFDPFFTTKRPAEGTGLGLSLVANLVRSRRGKIVLRSAVGKGTMFRVELPTDWSEPT